MSKTTTRNRPLPVVPIVAVVIGVVVAIGLAIALFGGNGNGGSTATGGDGSASFGPVEVVGDALPAFAGGADPAVGEPAPELRGLTPAGDAISVGTSEPTVRVFVAHWCPHCQREVPVLVDLAEEGVFDDARLVAVLTGTNADAPNFPPAAWLEREGWPGEIMLDDETFTAARAYGLDGYPFAVYLDADGEVVARTSGETPADAIQDLTRSITA